MKLDPMPTSLSLFFNDFRLLFTFDLLKHKYQPYFSMIFLSYCIIHSCQYHVVTPKRNYLHLHYLSNGNNGALIHYMYATKHLKLGYILLSKI